MRAKEFLSELNMAPGNLMKFAQSPAAAQFQAGFEAEVLLPGTYSDDEFVIDYDKDETLPRNLDIGDIQSFFELRRNDNILEEINNQYSEWVDKHASSAVEDDIDGRITFLQDEDEDLDYDSAREQAWDELYDEYMQGSNVPSLYDYCKDNRWNTYTDLAEAFNIDWPYFTSSNDFAEAVGDYAYLLNRLVGEKVEVLDAYHGEGKSPGIWYLEPDESIEANEEDFMGVEIVSPPMPLMQMLDKMEKTLNWVADEGGYTNATTGFHVGVSMGNTTKNVDYIKLALFLGDEYILQRFGRTGSTYTASSMALIKKAIEYRLDQKEIAEQLYKMKTGLLNDASKRIFEGNASKHVSINMRENYIEFRSMGNDYLTHVDAIKDVVLRYVRAYAVAIDPMAERQEYLKKLAKILNPSGTDQLTPFIKYAAGQVSKSDLVNYLFVGQKIKKADKQASPPADFTGVPQPMRMPTPASAAGGPTAAETPG